MAYIRPCGDVFISDSWQGHKDRKPKASSEPGVDYAVGKGTVVRAPAAGRVIGIKDDTHGPSGRAMMIRTGNDWHRALHLSEIVVKRGEFVQGQIIAKSGASAMGSESGVGAHLHWSYWRNRTTAPTPGLTPTQDFEAVVGAPAAVGVMGGGALKEDDMFSDADRKLLRDVMRQVNNTHAGVWRGGTVTLGKKKEVFLVGILPLVQQTHTMLAAQAGEIEALKAIIEQLTSKQSIVIDDAPVNAARDRGMREANAGFLDTPTRLTPGPGIEIPLAGGGDGDAVIDPLADDPPIDPNIVNPPDQAEIDSPAVQPGEPDPGGQVDPRLGVREGIDLGAAVRGVANPGG